MKPLSVMQTAITYAALVLVGISVSGCGDSGDKPNYPKVSGTVTFDGKPLPSGTITLMPLDLKNSSASGTIDANGQFQLATHSPGDGCAPGEYEVSIQSWETEPGMDTPGKSRIPEKYSQPKVSNLKQSIGSEATQTIKFDLTK